MIPDGTTAPRRRYAGEVPERLVVVNGGSGAGKSGIVRCLQAILPDPWLTFGIDGFIEALPPALQDSDASIGFGPAGEVAVGAAFRQLEQAWMAGIAATVRAGARVIVDDVFLSGADSQRRWAVAAGDLEVVWVGVHCDPTVAAAREVARGDRTIGMAASQAEVVHRGVRYDLEVDTTRTEALDCARTIAARLS